MTQFLIYEGCQYLPETFQAVIFQFNSPLILCLWTLRFQTRGTAAFLVVTHCKPDISARCQWSFHDSPGWFFSTKKLLAERSGWERGELIPCKSSFFFFFPLPALPELRGVLTLVGAWLSRGVLHSTPLWKFCSQGMLDKSWISATDLNYWEMFWQLE